VQQYTYTALVRLLYTWMRVYMKSDEWLLFRVPRYDCKYSRLGLTRHELNTCRSETDVIFRHLVHITSKRHWSNDCRLLQECVQLCMTSCTHWCSSQELFFVKTHLHRHWTVLHWLANIQFSVYHVIVTYYLLNIGYTQICVFADLRPS